MEPEDLPKVADLPRSRHPWLSAACGPVHGLLALERALHQIPDAIPRILTEHEDGVHLLHDRHFDAIACAPGPSPPASSEPPRQPCAWRRRCRRAGVPWPVRGRPAGCGSGRRYRSGPGRRGRPVRRACVPCRPGRTARRVISTRPRVMRAAVVLLPSPKPWQMPAPMAMTFFSAAPSSTPDGVVVRVQPEAGPEKMAWMARASSRSVDATATAAGSPAAISRAKVGPERTAMPGPEARPDDLFEHFRHAHQGAVLNALGRADEHHFRAAATAAPG